MTGGSGFIGTHLRSELADQEKDVVILVRNQENIELFPNEKAIVGDITEPETINIHDCNKVIHLAAQTSTEFSIDHPSQTWRVNADGTLNILEEARKENVDRFLYASTASVYGNPQYLPIDESHPCNPNEPYGASKLAGDALSRSYARSYEMDVVVTRIFNTFGLGQPSYNVVPTIVAQAKEDDVIELGNLSPSRDFIYIKDVIDGMMTVLQNGASGSAYNIAQGESISIGDLAKEVCSIVPGDHEIETSTDRKRSADIEILDHIADISSINELGWEPNYSLSQGLKEAISNF